MSKRADWKIDFIHHEDIDIVEATFDAVHLEDRSDVAEWERRVRALFETYGRKVDLLIDLGGLSVKPSISRAFGRARAAVLSDFALRSFRFGADAWTATSVSLTAVLDGADDNLFRSRDDALAALLRDREGA